METLGRIIQKKILKTFLVVIVAVIAMFVTYSFQEMRRSIVSALEILTTQTFAIATGNILRQDGFMVQQDVDRFVKKYAQQESIGATVLVEINGRGMAKSISPSRYSWLSFEKEMTSSLGSGEILKIMTKIDASERVASQIVYLSAIIISMVLGGVAVKVGLSRSVAKATSAISMAVDHVNALASDAVNKGTGKKPFTGLIGIKEVDDLVTATTRFVQEIAASSSLLEKSQMEFRESEHKAGVATEMAKMAQNLAHDLKNPLITFDFVMRSKNWSDFLEMKDQMGRALMTIRSILTGINGASSREAIDIQMTTFNIEVMINDIRRLFKYESTLVSYTGPAEISAYLDVVALERAIGNLVKNASESGAASIKINATIQNRDLCIEVADNGPGLPDVVRAHLFERGRTHGKTKGSGLGLHNVQMIAERHGGQVTHIRHNSWTQFKITLPNAVSDEWSAIEYPNLESSPKEDRGILGGVLVVLPDKIRESAIISRLESLGVLISNIDGPTMPILVFASIDDPTTDKLEARLIIDDPRQSPEQAAQKVANVYLSMLRVLEDEQKYV